MWKKSTKVGHSDTVSLHIPWIPPPSPTLIHDTRPVAYQQLFNLLKCKAAGSQKYLFNSSMSRYALG